MFLQLEEAKNKLEDYERLSKTQRNLTSENVELEHELAALNTRLEQADKARKAEVSETKMRYEGQMNSMRDELKSLHNQVDRNTKTSPRQFLNNFLTKITLNFRSQDLKEKEITIGKCWKLPKNRWQISEVVKRIPEVKGHQYPALMRYFLS